jgi:hypothetical protein
MFRHLNNPNIVNRNFKQEQDHNETINMESIVKIQKHKFNPHEPIFLSVSQFEELCKTTYDGNTPFTITAIVDKDKEISANEINEKIDNITITEIKNEEPEYPAPNSNVDPEPYVYKKQKQKKK